LFLADIHGVPIKKLFFLKNFSFANFDEYWTVSPSLGATGTYGTYQIILIVSPHADWEERGIAPVTAQYFSCRFG
jgi:hypothetical protein